MCDRRRRVFEFSLGSQTENHALRPRYRDYYGYCLGSYECLSDLEKLCGGIQGVYYWNAPRCTADLVLRRRDLGGAGEETCATFTHDCLYRISGSVYPTGNFWQTQPAES